MKIYLSGIPVHPLQTNHLLTTISHLYRLHYLADESTVWASLDSFEPHVWALADKSSLTRYHASVKAGCVRITNNRIRWAPTVDGSQSSPVLDIDLSQLTEDAATHFTLVIDHCETGEDSEVTIIDNSSRQAYAGGCYNSDGVRVIDARRYRSRQLMWKDPVTGEVNFSPSPESSTFYDDVEDYEAAHAMVYGTKFSATGMTKSQTVHLRENLGDYCIEFSPEEMRALVQHSHAGLKEISSHIAQVVETQVKNSHAGFDLGDI